MKTIYIFITLLFTAILMAFVGNQNQHKEFNTEIHAVKWYTYEQAVALAKKNPRPIFVDVYTDWCGWCKVMDKNTFNHPEISNYLNKKFYPVKLNAESSEMTVYQGQTLTNSQLASSIFKVSSYPTTVYLEANERVLQPLPGYLNPNQFNPIIHFIGDGIYKTTTWEEFQVNFKDTIQ
jgi:thioredoxin-related protein